MKIQFDTDSIRRFFINLYNEVNNPQKSGLWDRLTVWLSGIVSKMFKHGGGEYGRPVWPAISPKIYGKTRIGSDGGKYGTYSAGSKPLEASGKYKESFKRKIQTPRFITFGSVNILADVMPYAGWQTGRARRYVLPKQEDAQFESEKQQIKEDWLFDIIKKSAMGATQ